MGSLANTPVNAALAHGKPPSPSSPLVTRTPQLKGLAKLAISEETASNGGITPGWRTVQEAAPQAPRRGVLVGAALLLGAVVALERAAASSTSLPPDDAASIDPADTTWMLVATLAVLMMVPALGLFEAGLLRAKNSLSVLMQCFAGLAVLSTLWFVVGFGLCFGAVDAGVYADWRSHLLLSGVPWRAPLPSAPTIPGVLFAAFQNMFAAITPLLVTGAFAERKRFESFLAFIVLWSLVVYYPLCHWYACAAGPRVPSLTRARCCLLLQQLTARVPAPSGGHAGSGAAAG